MISSRLWKKDGLKSRIRKDNTNSSKHKDTSVNNLLNEAKNCKNVNHSPQEKALQERAVDLTSPDEVNLMSRVSEESEKNSKNRPWYSSILSPTYKSRSEDFKRIFREIPDDERLLVDYSCALQKEVLIHGRLYVSQNYICFHANIFKWETSLSIQLSDVISITKEKTAHLIPNAILIQCPAKKFFFTSFFSRDKTYMTLQKIWNNASMEKTMNTNETWQIIHDHYGEELGLSSTDESDDNHLSKQDRHEAKRPDDISLETRAEEVAELDDRAASIFDDKYYLDRILKMDSDLSSKSEEKIPTSSLNSDEKGEESSSTSASSHSGRLLIDTIIPLDVDDVLTLLFTSSKFFLDFHASRNTTDLKQSAWVQDTATGKKERKTSFTISLNRTLGPKTSHVTEIQTMLPSSVPSSFYSIDVDSTNSGIPYAESFSIWTHYRLKKTSENETSLKIYADIKYKKNLWSLVKTFIEKSCWSGMQEYFNSLVQELINECERKGVMVDKSKTVTQGPSNVSTRQSESRESFTTVSPSSVRKLIQNDQTNDARISHGDNNIIFSWILLIAILCLIVINGLLYFKLTSFETSNYTITDLHVLKNTPKTEEDWINLLQQQESLHTVEIKKWQRVLHTAVQLLKQVLINDHRLH
ncbi:hypothetical protein QAD02_004161 [Eretmocerus hayati]|uniref:Uncharacterized protein n=1 Tax=Eretmocerus hayati TaxID=131215 RepID=A0ACC2NTN4_9HYME|nr:hypothetical protein QAD02_004161 [Eretmocerus hayati]